MNKSSAPSAQKSTYSQILCCVLERWTRTLSQILHGKTDWRGSKVHQSTELLDRIDGEPMEFECDIFPGFTTLQLSHKVEELLLRLSVTPEKFIGRVIFMSMFNDISWGSKDNKKECESNSQLVSLSMQRDSEQDNDHYSGLDQSKTGILSVKTAHKENGTKSLRKWCWHSQKADTQSSEPRVHCPEE